MRTVNICDAKTQLSRLVEQAANGEPFIIAKAGKPKGLSAEVGLLTAEAELARYGHPVRVI